MSAGAGQSDRHQRKARARAAADPIAAWLVSEECGMREPEAIAASLPRFG